MIKMTLENDIQGEITISKMTENDLDEIITIENLSFKDPWERAIFEKELKNEWSRSIVVRLNGIVAGYMIYWFVVDEMHLLNIAVNPALRKMGIAERMVKNLVEEARRLGVRFITLEVRKGNTAAQNLYKKFGFISTGLRRKYYSDGEDAVVMTLYFTPDDSSNGL